MPEHAAFLQSLPAALDREVVRAIGSRATESANAAVEAFLAAMIWGYGSIGYGPFRIHRALTESPEAGQRLWRVARTLAEAGPLPAYERLGGDSRLVGLGPAFGTKYLYFTQPREAASMALILDRLVARWLDREAGITINPIPWSVRTYRRYLDHMQEWAATLGCRPDDLEYGMFQAMANEFGGQWASSD
jgi:hypothetical protein